MRVQLQRLQARHALSQPEQLPNVAVTPTMPVGLRTPSVEALPLPGAWHSCGQST
jgi:hypothetical protein